MSPSPSPSPTHQANNAGTGKMLGSAATTDIDAAVLFCSAVVNIIESGLYILRFSTPLEELPQYFLRFVIIRYIRIHNSLLYKLEEVLCAN